MKQQYWDFMVQCKFETYYYDLYFEKSVFCDKAIKIITTVLGSGAVVTWAIWEKFKWLLILLTSFSTVLNLIKDKLPYQARVTELSNLNKKLSKLYNEIESFWRKIELSENGLNNINDSDIEKKLSLYKSKWDELCNNCLEGDSLPEKVKSTNKLDLKTNQYFISTFNLNNDNEEEKK